VAKEEKSLGKVEKIEKSPLEKLRYGKLPSLKRILRKKNIEKRVFSKRYTA